MIWRYNYDERIQGIHEERDYEAGVHGIHRRKKPETLDALAQTLVDFAASKGFSISKEDVLNSIPDELKSGKVEISDDMLDAVAGGRCFQDWVKDIAYDFVKSLEDSGWL